MKYVTKQYERDEDDVMPGQPGPPRKLAQKLMEESSGVEYLLIYRKCGWTWWEATEWTWQKMIWGDWVVDMGRVGFGLTKKLAHKHMERCEV